MNRNTKIIAICNDKGGTGKTTTAINLAAGLVYTGHRVLLVDADQQANLTSIFQIKEPSLTLYDSFINEQTPLPLVMFPNGLSLVPSSHQLFGIGITLVKRQAMAAKVGLSPLDCRQILKQKIMAEKGGFDFIIIDCPPSDSIMTLNALNAATHVIITTTPEYFSISGVTNYMRMIEVVNSGRETDLQLAGILITNYEVSSIGHVKGESYLRHIGKKYVYNTRIRHSRPIYNASLAHMDIFTYDPKSNGALDYQLFTQEFLSKI